MKINLTTLGCPKNIVDSEFDQILVPFLFEGKLANKTVFSNEDVIYVDISPTSGTRLLECINVSGKFHCMFSLHFTISDEAAKRLSRELSKLDLVYEDGNEFLSEDLIIYLDGVKESELKVSSSLKGSRAVSDIQITSSVIADSESEGRILSI